MTRLLVLLALASCVAPADSLGDAGTGPADAGTLPATSLRVRGTFHSSHEEGLGCSWSDDLDLTVSDLQGSPRIESWSPIAMPCPVVTEDLVECRSPWVTQYVTYWDWLVLDPDHARWTIQVGQWWCAADYQVRDFTRTP